MNLYRLLKFGLKVVISVVSRVDRQKRVHLWVISENLGSTLIVGT